MFYYKVWREQPKPALRFLGYSWGKTLIAPYCQTKLVLAERFSESVLVQLSRLARNVLLVGLSRVRGLPKCFISALYNAPVLPSPLCRFLVLAPSYKLNYAMPAVDVKLALFQFFDKGSFLDTIYFQTLTGSQESGRSGGGTARTGWRG